MIKSIFLTSLSLILFSSSTLANQNGISLQGRIFKPDGNPLEGSSVQFIVQIWSPGSESCLLYEELQTINLAGSSGLFSLTINDGSGTRLDNPTYPIDRIFANRDSITLDNSRCKNGTSYTPNAYDGRKLAIYFKDESLSVYEPLPIMNLNFSPQAMYALEAQKIGPFPANTIFRAIDINGAPALAPALDPTQLANLTNLIAGTSPQYATATQFNTVQTFAKATLPTCGAGEVLKANGTSFSCVPDAGNPTLPSVGAIGLNTIDNSNFAQTWNWSSGTNQNLMNLNANSITSGSLFSVSTSSTSLNSTNGLLEVANKGTSTNGVLARFQANSTTDSGLTILTNGNVGMGTTTPSRPLQLETNNNGSYNTIHVKNLNSGTGAFSGITASNSANQFLEFIMGSNNASTLLYTGGPSGAQAAIGVTHNVPLSFATNNAFRMVITGAGDVGIGLTNPTSKLQVAGNITPNATASRDLGTSSLRWNNIYLANAPDVSSDARLKKDIQISDLGLDFINSLRPVSWIWKNEDQGPSRHYGLIAQEAASAIAEAKGHVSDKVIVSYNEEADSYSVRYTELISPLIKAVQELYNKFADTERYIEYLKAQKADQESLQVVNYELNTKIKKIEVENAELKARLEKIEELLNSK